MRLSGRLPDFPWNTIAADRQRAQEHPGGLVDLSVGTPVDPTPAFVQFAARSAGDSPGYPQVWGTPEVRAAIVGYLVRRWNSPQLNERRVMPVVGTKELVALLPTLLGLGPQDTVVIPRTAYPTYRVGAELVGARVVASDDPAELGGLSPSLIWINSPANPHGATFDRDGVRRWIDFARRQNSLLASDECYGEFGWDVAPVSVLDREVSEGETAGVLAVHSLSKRSNMAGYRAGFVAGDINVVTELIAVRKHLGLMVPTPVQAAMVAALADQGHVEEQRARYLARRTVLAAALEAAGFRIDASEGSLYLWATRAEPCRRTVAFLAERGILTAPGDFYGDPTHVRVALTATDERVAAAAERLVAG
ncbi:succinyldiaminopimelate transaminase [Propionicicella superfundia]|uniref:succinyldiaminopimelate transaminase n=1 Tax=Propionicicella superfundia TaxID=348582 RepID=UPI000408A939|nr:succinyldiaminopimelate transaminase [Propionicicella superfundia]